GSGYGPSWRSPAGVSRSVSVPPNCSYCTNLRYLSRELYELLIQVVEGLAAGQDLGENHGQELGHEQGGEYQLDLPAATVRDQVDRGEGGEDGGEQGKTQAAAASHQAVQGEGRQGHRRGGRQIEDVEVYLVLLLGCHRHEPRPREQPEGNGGDQEVPERDRGVAEPAAPWFRCAHGRVAGDGGSGGDRAFAQGRPRRQERFRL